MENDKSRKNIKVNGVKESKKKIMRKSYEMEGKN